MAEAEGEVELVQDVLVLKRIRVRYTLRARPGDEAVARRVHDVHRDGCPVYRSVSGCIDITTEMEVKTE